MSEANISASAILFLPASGKEEREGLGETASLEKCALEVEYVISPHEERMELNKWALHEQHLNFAIISVKSTNLFCSFRSLSIHLTKPLLDLWQCLKKWKRCITVSLIARFPLCGPTQPTRP